jgi:hypothetical protein
MVKKFKSILPLMLAKLASREFGNQKGILKAKPQRERKGFYDFI